MANKTRQSSSGIKGELGPNTVSRLAQLRAKQSAGTIGWDDADPELLTRTIGRMTQQGVLVSFSKTSDGGALCMFLKDGAESEKLYFAHDGELTEKLTELYELYE